MPTSSQNAIRIAASAKAGPLSRVRKQFNTLVKKLEAERARLALWRDALPTIRAVADSELMPLIATFDARYRQLLFLYDQAWSNKTIGKKDRQKLSDLICETAQDLMNRGGDDAAVKAIYDKHSIYAFDMESMGEDKGIILAMIRDATGIELDADTDFSTPQTLAAALEAKMEEHARREEAAAEARQARPARPSAREVRQQAEEAKLKQSVRDIFRKLASALHPDRETDPAERTRKTDLMQRANAAYAANDLLGLLELQLAVEQIDQAGLDNLGDDRIKQYNRILEGQVAEIQVDIMALQTALAIDMGLDLDDHATPKTMLRNLRAEIGNMQSDVEQVEEDLVRFTDIKVLKAWLKHYQIGAHARDVDKPWF